MASRGGGVVQEFEIEYPDGGRINLIDHLLQANSLTLMNRRRSDTGSCAPLTLPSHSLSGANQSFAMKAAAADVSETVTENEFIVGAANSSLTSCLTP